MENYLKEIMTPSILDKLVLADFVVRKDLTSLCSTAPEKEVGYLGLGCIAPETQFSNKGG